jgi:hypothetical protein
MLSQRFIYLRIYLCSIALSPLNYVLCLPGSGSEVRTLVSTAQFLMLEAWSPLFNLAFTGSGTN